MRRALSILLGLILATAFTATVPVRAEAAVRLRISPAAPMANEVFNASGGLKSRVVRPVQLERLDGSQWAIVATENTVKSGRFVISASAAVAGGYRVVAPKVTVKGKVYGRVVTSTTSLKLAPQQLALTLPTLVFRNQTVTAALVAKPVRKGRVVDLEALRGSDWIAIGTGKQDSKGNLKIRLAATDVGEFVYRARALPAKGAAEVTSNETPLTIKPDKIVVSDQARPLTSAETADIKSFKTSTGKLVFDGDAPTSVRKLKKGQIVPVPPRVGIATGALRQVSSVKTSHGITTVGTRDADLPDVVKNVPDEAAAFAVTTTSTTFTPGTGVTVDRTPARVLRGKKGTGLRAAGAGALELSINAELRSGPAFLKAKGTMSVAPVIDFELDADWGQITHYKLGAGVEVSDDMTLTAGFGGTKKSPKIVVGTLRHLAVSFIGPVPVWLEMVAPVYLQADASGQVAVVVGYTRSGRSTAGIENQRGTLKPEIYTTNVATQSTINEVRAEGTLGAFAGAEPQLLLYSTGGAYAKLGYRAELKLAFSPGGLTCRLQYGPHAEFGVKSADWIEKLTGQKFKVNAEVHFDKHSYDLCPDLGPTEVQSVSPFYSNGDLRREWDVEDATGRASDVYCYVGSPVAPGGGVWECSPNGFLVCWADPDAPDWVVLCGDDPWSHHVLRIEAQFEGTPIPSGNDQRPWGIELADGTRCVSRHGGSWSGRPNDDFIGVYSCSTGGDDFLVVLSGPEDAERIDRSRPTWTAKIGYLEDDPRAANKPTTAVVKKAWYATARG